MLWILLKKPFFFFFFLTDLGFDIKTLVWEPGSISTERSRGGAGRGEHSRSDPPPLASPLLRAARLGSARRSGEAAKLRAAVGKFRSMAERPGLRRRGGAEGERPLWAEPSGKRPPAWPAGSPPSGRSTGSVSASPDPRPVPLPCRGSRAALCSPRPPQPLSLFSSFGCLFQPLLFQVAGLQSLDPRE